MSDETTGVTTPEATALPETPATDETTATPTPAPNGTAASAASAAASAPEMAAGEDLEQMPPLDEIEVPGGEVNDRYGSGSELRQGDLVTGTVVHIDHEGVLVDVGAKTEGLIRPNELSREPVQNMEDVVKVGDRIEVLVLEPEGRDGNMLLSKKRADFEKAWDRVQESLKTGETLTAMVTDRVKGGLTVDLGIRGFVPASHVGNGKLKNLEKFVGQSVPLKVLEVDREHRKVVLSHRLATEEEREKQKQDTIGSLEEGQTRTGTIRRVTDYGAFVDLGGIDGLLHVSEMSWTRVKHPSDVVKVGQEVQVMILRLSLEQGRVSLGMRQILPDPWETVAEKYHVNDVVEGEITRLVPFGAFVLLEGGIEGIIPNSELAHRRIAKPSDVVEANQTVQVKVIDVRPEERRLTLSLRALQPRDPAPAPGAAGAPGAAPSTEEGAGGGRRDKRDKRRGRGEEDDVDWRAYTSRDSGGVTIGDMFGDMFATSRGKAGPAGAGGGTKKRGRRYEEDEDDLENFEDDFDPNAPTAEGEEGAVGIDGAVVATTEPAADAEEGTAEAEAETKSDEE
ncbi:MAG TPA: 30S ribosomal protein S1 [Armatimonadaceae bacterium]|nr:30S ribosomal protein S1 [Armatimonadaceae bacterium]